MTSIGKVVIDTDCGVDDALALMLALGSNRCQIEAITCCYGNTPLDNVCKNVMRVLTLCNRKVPIFRGCYGPLLKKARKRDMAYHAEDGLGNCAHLYSTGDLQESDVPAAMALIRLTKEHPGEITLVALGPLTNLALAHRIDPDFTRRLKSIVCMGGNSKGQGNTTEVAEFNFYTDPESANMVLRETCCPFTLVPWETCPEFGLKYSLHEELSHIDSAKGRFYRDVTKLMPIRARAKGRELITDCDFLGMVAALYPECVTSTTESQLAVECEGTLSRGLTVLLRSDETPANKITIVTAFNRDLLDELRRQMIRDHSKSV